MLNLWQCLSSTTAGYDWAPISSVLWKDLKGFMLKTGPKHQAHLIGVDVGIEQKIARLIYKA